MAGKKGRIIRSKFDLMTKVELEELLRERKTASAEHEAKRTKPVSKEWKKEKDRLHRQLKYLEQKIANHEDRQVYLLQNLPGYMTAGVEAARSNDSTSNHTETQDTNVNGGESHEHVDMRISNDSTSNHAETQDTNVNGDESHEHVGKRISKYDRMSKVELEELLREMKTASAEHEAKRTKPVSKEWYREKNRLHTQLKYLGKAIEDYDQRQVLLRKIKPVYMLNHGNNAIISSGVVSIEQTVVGAARYNDLNSVESGVVRNEETVVEAAKTNNLNSIEVETDRVKNTMHFHLSKYFICDSLTSENRMKLINDANRHDRARFALGNKSELDPIKLNIYDQHTSEIRRLFKMLKMEKEAEEEEIINAMVATGDPNALLFMQYNSAVSGMSMMHHDVLDESFELDDESMSLRQAILDAKSIPDDSSYKPNPVLVRYWYQTYICRVYEKQSELCRECFDNYHVPMADLLADRLQREAGVTPTRSRNKKNSLIRLKNERHSDSFLMESFHREYESVIRSATVLSLINTNGDTDDCELPIFLCNEE